MKVAINKDIGGFRLPDSAILRLVELGMTHFVQETEDLSGMPQDSMFVWESYDKPGRERALTLSYQSREEAAKDTRVIKVVEEVILSGCKDIIIIEIPGDIEWYIDENEMGIESIHEKHRIWSE